jgi:hypothetical protein
LPPAGAATNPSGRQPAGEHELAGRFFLFGFGTRFVSSAEAERELKLKVGLQQFAARGYGRNLLDFGRTSPSKLPI